MIRQLFLNTGSDQAIEFTQKHWGICDGKEAYINYNGKYFNLSLDGKYYGLKQFRS
jgi:hypothetical protein